MHRSLAAPLREAIGVWGRARWRLRARAYLATVELTAEAAAPKVPTIFSSRAKLTPACPVWLKSSRSRCGGPRASMYSGRWQQGRSRATQALLRVPLNHRPVIAAVVARRMPWRCWQQGNSRTDAV